MTPQFKEFFDKLCQRWPEMFKKWTPCDGFMISRILEDGLKYTKFYDTKCNREYLWFLHELATALGGVVWVEAVIRSGEPKILGWNGRWYVDCDHYCNALPTKDTQLLALESAVIALGEEVMRKENRC